jgi:hypothetical protein
MGHSIDFALDVGGLAKPPPNLDDDPKNENNGPALRKRSMPETRADEVRNKKQRGQRRRSMPPPGVANCELYLQNLFIIFERAG